MTALVLDASVALSWCFDNEATEAGDRLLEQLTEENAAVPSIWPLEVANILALSERRNRITSARTAQFVALLETLSISVDEETSAHALGRVLNLARAQRLTAYDAAYLELAMRLGVPLASKDRDLCDAAERVGIAVVRAG
ncbi:MAG TPA: type II toxin-antitoxin system VapC family toxin [Stellaceae bacterium]|jgi:predicted nucleic acid-binding protein|nr:type II toxin-antitoxin system VapC family toxin [Stellaceae bacterium]